MTFRHVVLFRVRDDVAGPELSDAVENLTRLGDWPGVLEWTIAMSLDERKGRIVVEDATFVDIDTFHMWRAAEAHRQVASQMSKIADWLVGIGRPDPPGIRASSSPPKLPVASLAWEMDEYCHFACGSR